MKSQRYLFFVIALLCEMVAPLKATDRAEIVAELRGHQSAALRAEKIRAYTSSNENTDEVIAALEVFYSNEETSEVRQAVVQTIGGIVYLQKLSFPKVYLQALRDEDPEVIRECLSMIGMTSEMNTPPEVIPIIIKFCPHRSSRIRSVAITALKTSIKNPSETQLTLMRQATHDRDPLVRMNAVSAIWKWTDDLTFAVEYWLGELETENDPEKIQAQENTAKFAQIAGAEIIRTLGIEEPEKLIPVLIEHLRNGSSLVRAAAARSLGAVAIETDESREVSKRLNVQKHLESLLDDEIENVRVNAAIGLDRLKNPTDSSIH